MYTCTVIAAQPGWRLCLPCFGDQPPLLRIVECPIIGWVVEVERNGDEDCPAITINPLTAGLAGLAGEAERNTNGRLYYCSPRGQFEDSDGRVYEDREDAMTAMATTLRRVDDGGI